MSDTPKTSDARPNIVLICVDQWRGDCLVNHPVVQTPYLNNLAHNGARMSKAYAACPSCIAARASLFTGLTPASHGRVGYQDRVPWNYPVTLGGEFTRAGYQTQVVGKMHVHPPRKCMGFENVILHDGYLHCGRDGERDWRMFDDYVTWLRQRTDPAADYFDHGLNCNSYVVRPWDKAEELHPTNFVVSESINFLRRRDPTRPFFLFMSLHRPHPPLDPPAWALEQYLNVDIPDAPMGDWVEAFEPFRNDVAPDPFVQRTPPHLRRRTLAGYYGHMTHIDHQINRFAESLIDFHLQHNTIIAFVSDHGDLMGDHGLWRKAPPYEGSAHVPLFFHGTGIKPRVVSDIPVELRDLMPTLLDLAGAEIPASVEGQSFASTLRGQTQPEFRPWIHGEHTCFGSSMHYITDGKEKYIWMAWSGAEQLFDLVRDPQELHDLSMEKPSRVAHWRQLLIEELRNRPEGFVEEGRLVSNRKVTPVLPHILQR